MRLQLQTHLRRLAALSLLVSLSAIVALAQTTSFTYQGRLSDGGTPANGNYDLQFALFDSVSGGIQIGAPRFREIGARLTGQVTGVKYERLDLLLINAIKEQQQEIEQLKEELRHLRTASGRRTNGAHADKAQSLWRQVTADRRGRRRNSFRGR